MDIQNINSIIWCKNAIVYVVLKDAMGNTNTIFKGTNTSYKLKYDANGGTNAPAEETAYFGMPYKVTLKKPNYEGKYFWVGVQIKMQMLQVICKMTRYLQIYLQEHQAP